MISKRLLSMTFSFLLTLTVLAAAPACRVEVDRDEGAFEEAGEELDKGVDKLGEKIEDAGERIQDRAENAN